MQLRRSKATGKLWQCTEDFKFTGFYHEGVDCWIPRSVDIKIFKRVTYAVANNIQFK